MDTIEKAVITLLKSAVTGSRIELPDGFDINQLYSRVRAHHMAALVYQGAVNCRVDPGLPVMQRLFQSYCKSLQVSERQMQALKQVFAAFDEKRVDYLPLKGCMMKELYPRPELRSMGDADVLIRVKQYDQIIPIMRELGFEESEGADHHFVWKSDSLELELHKSILVPNLVSDFEYFQDTWAHAAPAEGTRFAMDDESTFAFLFAHFSRHFAGSGIGCRHVVDLWVYLRSHPEMDEVYLRTLLVKLNLWPFYQNIRKLIAVWFEDAAADEKTEVLTRVIFANGSWGSLTNYTLGRSLRDTGGDSSAAKSRLQYILRRLNPGREHLQNLYPILGRYPWLYPVMWCARIVKKVFTRSVWRRTGTQLHALSKQNLQSRKEMLEYLGLIGGAETDQHKV